MTSESDSTPRRRPPTIDLTATEVEAEKPPQSAGARVNEGAKAEDAPGEVTGRTPARRRTLYAPIAIIAVIAIGAVSAELWRAGYLSPRAPAASPDGVAPKPSIVEEVSARLEKLEDALKAPRPDPALAGRLTAAEAQTKSLSDSLAALNRRVDGIATAAQNARAQADAAAAAADAAKDAAQASVRRSDLDALANRIAALENAVKSLSGEVASRPTSADDLAARSAVAAEALRAAVERGAPYRAELALVKSLGADQSATAPLEPFAANGVPNAAALAAELATLTPAMSRATGPEPADNSLFGRLEANAQKLVHVTPIDTPPGDDPSSLIARINADAARADITAALADIGRLPDPAKTVAAPWVEKASARNGAIAASRQIAAAALAALGKSQ